MQANNQNAAVLSLSELQRIKESCSLNQKRDQEYKQNVRETLFQKSQARLKNWPNTIQATRERKEKDRIHKLEDEEIERRKVDAVEEALQNEFRNEAISKANHQLYDQQDRVKAFHSKMLMCDVLAEREQQKKLQKEKKKQVSQREKEWEEFELQKLAEQDEKAREDLEKVYKKKMTNAKMIKDQLHDFKLGYVRKMQEEMIEGELLKRKVAEDLKKEQEKERKKQEGVQRLMNEQRKCNEEQMRLLEIQRQREEEDDAQIANFATKKSQLEQLRKDKEEQKFQEKQREKQKLIDRQSKQLMELQSTEVVHLNKQVAEAENKAAVLFAEQEKRRSEMKSAIERS